MQARIGKVAQCVLIHQFLQRGIQCKHSVMHTMHLWFEPILRVTMQEGGRCRHLDTVKAQTLLSHAPQQK